MAYYNYRRTHQGYKLKENGYKIPGQVHLSKNLTNFKESNKLEITGEIMSGKEGDEKNLIVTLYPVKIEDENMKVLA